MLSLPLDMLYVPFKLAALSDLDKPFLEGLPEGEQPTFPPELQQSCRS